MSNRQAEIAAALDVVPPFTDEAALCAEIERRKTFIKNTLKQSGLKVLVLGISGGIDSTLAGRLCQLAVDRLNALDGVKKVNIKPQVDEITFADGHRPPDLVLPGMA